MSMVMPLREPDTHAVYTPHVTAPGSAMCGCATSPRQHLLTYRRRRSWTALQQCPSLWRSVGAVACSTRGTSSSCAQAGCQGRPTHARTRTRTGTYDHVEHCRHEHGRGSCQALGEPACSHALAQYGHRELRTGARWQGRGMGQAHRQRQRSWCWVSTATPNCSRRFDARWIGCAAASCP